MYQNTFPCPHCGSPNVNGTWACTGCGTTLIVYCPQCRGGNNTGSQFCQNCGSPLTQTTYAQGYPDQQQQQPQPQPQQQPYPYQQESYPQYDPYQQAGYATQDPYQQQPMPTHPTAGGWQDKLDQIVAKAKQIIMTTNPVYLLILGVIIIGMAGFLAYAFQAGLIKTGTTVKPKGPTDTTPPVITMITVKAGQGNSAIISWVTDEPSSSQVQWGVYPEPNQLTPIQNDPTTGQNMGVLIHQVAITPLAQNMDYLYRVISVDKDSNKAISPSMTAPPMSLHTTSFQSN